MSLTQNTAAVPFPAAAPFPVPPRALPPAFGVRERQAGPRTVSTERAARWLGLWARELDAAVQLGCLVTVPSAVPWRRRVPVVELRGLLEDRQRLAALRARARVVEAAAGARLLGISPARFARLARGGCFSPIGFRCAAGGGLAWGYAAAELRAFAARSPKLLGGRLPDALRRAVHDGEDRRAARWRGRRTLTLARQAEDAWQRAAVPAAVLEPPVLAAEVPDPGERARLLALRPPLAGRARPGPGGWDAVRRAVTARAAEAGRYRAELAGAMDRARRSLPVAASGAAGGGQGLRSGRRPSP